jgi:hypothetical protein
MPDAHRKLQYTVINGKSDTPSLWAVPAHHPRRRKGYRVALGTSLSQGDIRRNLAEMAGMSGSVRGSFNTGPVHHRVVAAYTQYTRDFLRNQTVYPCPVSNIYNLVFAPAPSSSLMPSYDIVQKLNETGLSSAMLGDTLSIFDERVQLTAGVRFHQSSPPATTPRRELCPVSTIKALPRRWWDSS